MLCSLKSVHVIIHVRMQCIFWGRGRIHVSRYKEQQKKIQIEGREKADNDKRRDK